MRTLIALSVLLGSSAVAAADEDWEKVVFRDDIPVTMPKDSYFRRQQRTCTANWETRHTCRRTLANLQGQWEIMRLRSALTTSAAVFDDVNVLKGETNAFERDYRVVIARPIH